MKTLVSGHRLYKLKNYNIDFIKESIKLCVDDIVNTFGFIQGYSGMASGVDLWYCEYLLKNKYMYYACIPFEDQKYEMGESERILRDELIRNSNKVYNIRNSVMVDMIEFAIVIWDGNKGGTHNVLQQLIEKKKDFIWINPVSEKIIKCL